MSNTQITYIPQGDIHPLSTQVVETDKAQTTASVIHGKTTAGGGSYVDVKVSPSGALQVGGNIIVNNASDTPINPATSENQGTMITHLSTIAGAVDPQRATTTDVAVTTQMKPADKFKWSFARNVASGVDSTFGSLIRTGAGMAVSQSGGNLVVTTGITAFSETIIRSLQSFSGQGVFRYSMQLSQRIVNQNFAVELVDVLGDNLAMTINSATSVTVTLPGTTLTTADDAGKGVWIGNISVASCLTQRATIASVSGNNITLTVAGFPASGTGTCSLFGYNFHQVIYNGATATTLGGGYNTQRLGWQNTAINATINTTAAPGHVGIIDNTRCLDTTYSDQVPGTATGLQITARGTHNQNIPDIGVNLFLQIRVFNGSTAPASTTTMTIGFVDMELFNPTMVNVSGIQPFGVKNGLPVVVQTMPTTTVTGTVTANTTETNLVAPSNSTVTTTASTNATLVKATAGTVYALTITNKSASQIFVKLYNLTTAPTVGTSIPVVTLPVPATSSIVHEFGRTGQRFTTGISLAVTGAFADADTTATTAGSVIVTNFI